MNGLPPSSRVSAACALGAFAVVRATPEALAGLRKQPGPPGGVPVAANLLKHADEQTVVALAAVLQAVGQFEMQEQVFTDWGVVASPRFPGRLSFAASLDKFHRAGAPSVSPSIIPFLSQHAVSSMIGLALHVHGPAVGFGGGGDGFAQALLAGLALLQEGDLPGVWVVLTGWDPEPSPGAEVVAGSESVCQAVALALLPDTAGARGAQLRLVPTAGPGAEVLSSQGLAALVEFLSGAATANQPRSWRCTVPGGCHMELTLQDVARDHSVVARAA